MKTIILSIFFLFLGTLDGFCQISISPDNSLPDPSAGLEVKSTSRGFLPPRMNRVILYGIQNPAEGLVVYCTDCSTSGAGAVVVRTGGYWKKLTPGCAMASVPAAATHTVTINGITWNWSAVTGASGYKWHTSDNYAQATDLGAATTKTETGLSCQSSYTRYVWAYNSCSVSPARVLSATTLQNPAAPSAGSHIPDRNSITWKWNSVTGATGYKWNTENNYSTATDMGTNLSKTETSLNCTTSYTRYVWAYGSCGTSGATTLTATTTACWSCGDNLTDSRDGKSYETVQIGTQCWMKENLNVGTRIDGGSDQANNGTIEKYCYNNDPELCSEYGGLYQWDEMVQYSIGSGNSSSWNPATTVTVQGICLSGWHIPSYDEWGTLNTFLGGSMVAGGKLKDTTYVHWAMPNMGASNLSGFTALPGGARTDGGNFIYMSGRGIFWASTQYSDDSGYIFYLLYNDDDFHYGYEPETSGISVRCLKD
jgi:uncharacterized protein (TIGR02145 family)